MINKERRYGQWAGNPKGNAEDKTRCVEVVMNTGEWHFHQCFRKRGFGKNKEYCKQHAKIEGGVK
jgi:hypothetical protein